MPSTAKNRTVKSIRLVSSASASILMGESKGGKALIGRISQHRPSETPSFEITTVLARILKKGKTERGDCAAIPGEAAPTLLVSSFFSLPSCLSIRFPPVFLSLFLPLPSRLPLLSALRKDESVL